MLNLWRSDLWAWATYTDTQKAAMLLGSVPTKLDRQHEKEWVLLTSPTCTRRIYSIQSHSRPTQLSVLPSTSLPPPLSCPRLNRMIFTTKYVRIRLANTKCFFVTYVTQDDIWTAFFHPLPPSHIHPPGRFKCTFFCLWGFVCVQVS